jgi:hypothetical protein
MIEKARNYDRGGVKTSSDYSTPLHSSDSTLIEDDTSHCYNTPLSSACSDEVIDPAILPLPTELNLDAIEVVDLTSVYDASLAKMSMSKSPASMY